jgi:hypothetical protein
MSKRSAGQTSFNFEIRPFAADMFCIREVGRPHIAYFKGDYQSSLKDIDLLGGVYLQMPKKDRHMYEDSVICFIDFALKHPEELEKLRGKVGDVQLALWSQTPMEPGGSVH